MTSAPPRAPDPGQPQRVRAILAIIEQERRDAAQESNHFTALDDQALVARGGGAVIAWQSWSAIIRETLTYLVGVANPTNASQSGLFVHVFAGLLLNRPGSAEYRADLGGVDTRFGAQTLPHHPGLSVPPGEVAKLAFTIAVRGVERASYPGNALLFSSAGHDPATLLDTAHFVFQVTT